MASLSVTGALGDGVERLADRRLLPLFVAVYVAQLANVVGAQSQLLAQRELLEEEPVLFGDAVALERLHLAIDLPLGVAILTWLVASIALVTLSMVALRAFVRIDATGDRDSDEGEFATADARAEPNARRTETSVGPESSVGPETSTDDSIYETDGLLAATVHGVVGGLFAATAITAGLALFLVPGLVVATALAFTYPVVAVERTNVVEAMRRSVGLVRGNWLRVFGVVLVVGFGFLAWSFLGGTVSLALGAVPVAGELLNVAFNAVGWLFSLAVLASAFERLAIARDEEEERWEGVDEELLP